MVTLSHPGAIGVGGDAACFPDRPNRGGTEVMMRVLIAYDGSAGADQAIALAGALRWPVGSTLRVVGVVEPAYLHARPPLGDTIAASELDDRSLAAANEAVTAAAASLRADRRIAEAVALLGRPGTAILEAAARFDADLVVVGSRGHGPVRRLVLGSVSGELVEQSACPVLVARTSAVERVVLAVDGSEGATLAESLVATWPMFEAVPIEVVSVAATMGPWRLGLAAPMEPEVAAAYAQEVRDVTAAHTKIASASADRLRAAGRDATPVVRTGHPADQIAAAADESGAGLVVMGSHGRTGLRGVLMGSVARDALHGSAASFLVARAPEAGSAEPA